MIVLNNYLDSACDIYRNYIIHLLSTNSELGSYDKRRILREAFERALDDFSSALEAVLKTDFSYSTDFLKERYDSSTIKEVLNNNSFLAPPCLPEMSYEVVRDAVEGGIANILMQSMSGYEYQTHYLKLLEVFDIGLNIHIWAVCIAFHRLEIDPWAAREFTESTFDHLFKVKEVRMGNFYPRSNDCVVFDELFRKLVKNKDLLARRFKYMNIDW